MREVRADCGDAVRRKIITVFGQKYREVTEGENPHANPGYRHFHGTMADLYEYPVSGAIYNRIGWYARLLDGRFDTHIPMDKPADAICLLEDRIKREIEQLLPAVLKSLREEDV